MTELHGLEKVWRSQKLLNKYDEVKFVVERVGKKWSGWPDLN
jgi:hypothetical protein